MGVIDLIRDDNHRFMAKIKLIELNVLGDRATTFCYNKPSSVMIDIINGCNYRCKWCMRETIDFKEMMSRKEDVIKILNQLGKVKRIELSGMGEPLIYPIDDLIEIINEASKHSSKVSIITNGSLLSKEKIEKLRRSKLSEIHVSVNSSNAEEYKNICGGNLNKVKENLKQLSLSGLPVIINVVAVQENIESYLEMVNLTVEVGVKRLDFQNLCEIEPLLEYTPVKDSPENRKAISEIQKYCDQKGIITNIGNLLHNSENQKCFATFFTLSIDTEGYVLPCCMWEGKHIVKADVLKSNWNSNEIRNFRKILIKRNYPSYCQKFCKKKPNVVDD